MTYVCPNVLQSYSLYSQNAFFSGWPLTAMNKFQEAVTSYQKALDLDPENDSYKSNLKK